MLNQFHRAVWTSLVLAGAAGASDAPAEAASRFARIGDVKVHYQSIGRGDTAVVFIHGWTCDSTFWQGQTPALAGKARVLLIDLPGHGRSDKPKIDYSMAYFAKAVAAVLDDAGVRSVVLVGHSMGTPVARQFYRLYPKRTRALIAVDGDLHVPLATQEEIDKHMVQFTGPGYKDAIGKAVDSMFTKATPAEARRRIKSTMQSAPQHVVVGAMRGMLDLAVWKDDAIDTPLLVVVAKQPYWPADHEKKVRKLNAKAEYRAVEGAGHFLMVDKPEVFNDTLVRFLRRIGVVDR